MNFLSHYYLHRKHDDNFFTVGLTTPDLLGFHSNRVRVTEFFLLEALDKYQNPDVRSCIRGMIIHLRLDKWFHSSDFFKENLSFLKENYIKMTDHDDMPHHICHILLEILLDRHLLFRTPDLADNFYDSYKRFDFDSITGLLSKLKNFDREKFLTLTTNISNSTFLNDYKDIPKIIGIIERVAKRIEFPFSLKPEAHTLISYMEDSFGALRDKMEKLFEGAKTQEF